MCQAMTCRNMAGSYSRTFSPRQSSDHAEDEIANFLGGRSSSNRSPGLGNQLPIQAKPGSVPTDDCFRGDQDEPLPPTRPQAPSNYPEESVEVSEAWAQMMPPLHSQLLTQCQHKLGGGVHSW